MCKRNKQTDLNKIHSEANLHEAAASVRFVAIMRSHEKTVKITLELRNQRKKTKPMLPNSKQ